MKVLIYKRTHKHDPNIEGIFGIHDCMGKVRNWEYDAVIGIGGNKPWGGEHTSIKHKINWIGLGPKRITPHPDRGINKVVFEHFELYEENGENIEENYPNLFEYMYRSRKRFDMSPNLPEKIFEEVEKILDSIKSAPASAAYDIVENDNYIVETRESTRPLQCSSCFRKGKTEITIQSC